METKEISTDTSNVQKRAGIDDKNSQKEGKTKRVDGDTQEIINDAAHQPDRDQLFDRGHRLIPGTSALSDISDWSGDKEERAKGDRDFKGDAVEELNSIGHITETDGMASANPKRTTIAGGTIDIHPEDMSDDELHKWADVLGVAGRGDMSRHKLIQEIRERI